MNNWLEVEVIRQERQDISGLVGLVKRNEKISSWKSKNEVYFFIFTFYTPFFPLESMLHPFSFSFVFLL